MILKSVSFKPEKTFQENAGKLDFEIAENGSFD
jgi:hypothetical protein